MSDEAKIETLATVKLRGRVEAVRFEGSGPAKIDLDLNWLGHGEKKIVTIEVSAIEALTIAAKRANESPRKRVFVSATFSLAIEEWPKDEGDVAATG